MAKLYAELGRRFPSGTAGQRDDGGCLRRPGALRNAGIGSARLGSRKADVIRRLGVPTSHSAGSLRYCVDGGGELLMAFDASGRMRLAASTSFSTRVHQLRTGSSLAHVKRVYPHARWIGKQLLRASRRSRVIFGSCSCGSVSFVGVTSAASDGRIRHYARLAGVPRAS